MYPWHKTPPAAPTSVPTYLYPDGTQSTAKPSDGQIFCIWDHNQVVETVWQWEDTQSKWIDVTVNNPKGSSSGARYINIPDFDLVKEFERLVDEGNSIKCECGSEKLGSPKHSTWCIKFNPND